MTKEKKEKPEFDISNLAAQVAMEEWFEAVVAPLMGKTYKSLVDQEIPPEQAVYLTGLCLQQLLNMGVTIPSR